MAGMSGRKQLQRATERLVAGGKLSAADLLRAARDLTARTPRELEVASILTRQFDRSRS